MEKQIFKIKLQNDIDAKLLSEITNLASKFNSSITFTINNNKSDAKSLINLMALSFNYDQDLIIEAEGWDESIAMRKIIEFLKESKVI